MKCLVKKKSPIPDYGSSKMKHVISLDSPVSHLRKYQESLEIPNLKVCEVKQIHSNKVVILEDNNLINQIVEADGIITQSKDVLLTIKTADCLPILFYDDKTETIANIHAGWRGLASGIIQNTISILKNKFLVSPLDLRVGIGPAICGKCYEVGAEIFDEFDCDRSLVASTKVKGKHYLDNKKTAVNLLKSLGVQNISVHPACTLETTGYPSYRENGTKSRLFTSLVQLF